MYTKPQLERFGSLRELTQFGFDADCDGTTLGIGDVDGTWIGCERS